MNQKFTFRIFLVLLISSSLTYGAEPLEESLTYLRHPQENIDLAHRERLQTLVAAYAPLLWWHKEETIGAMDPIEFIEKSSLWEVSPRGERRKIHRAGEIPLVSLPQHSHDSYLKFEGPHPRATRAPVMLWRLGEGLAAFRLGAAPRGSKRIVIEYWYHSAYNHVSNWGLGNHQGDWEGVAVLLELKFNENEIEHRPLAVYFASHEGGDWHCANALRWSETHPHAFSALGTHASYPHPGKYRVNGITDEAQAGIAWKSWENMRALVLEPFYGFGGSWGDLSFLSFMSGPIAPGPASKPQPRDRVPATAAALCSPQPAGSMQVDARILRNSFPG